MKAPLLGHIAVVSYLIPAVIAIVRWKSIPKVFQYILLCMIVNGIAVGGDIVNSCVKVFKLQSVA